MTIKTKILTIIVSIVGIVAFSLLFSQYYFSEQLAIKSTSETFTRISKNIREHLRQEAENTKNILKAESQYTDIGEEITFDPMHPALYGFIQILQIKNNLHAMYFAHPDGHFYEVVNMYNRPMLYKTLHAPQKAYWTIITIINNIEQHAFLDKDLKLIEKKRFVKNYDPRLRIWYTEAQNSKEVITTQPYYFVHSHQMGITYAKVLDDKGTVLAVDYTLSQLNMILAMQKSDSISEVFIVDNKGNKFSSSAYVQNKNGQKNVTLDKKLIKDIVENKIDQIIEYSHDKKRDFVIFKALSMSGTYLGIKVDVDILLKTHRDNLTYSFSIAFLLLLVSLPIIFFSTESIVKPIKELIVENTKIKERKFSDVQMIKTNIVELEALSESLVSMSKSIQEYARSQDALLDSIIKLIAEAIDKKSPYTGKHCERVPQIAMLLLDAAHKSQLDVFKDFTFASEEELREFEIGAWLHDCGKVTTPEFVVDKAVKLETIYNRIHEIRTRFEVLWRDAQIDYLKNKIDETALKRRQTQLLDDFAFIAMVNKGSEFMSYEKKARVKQIAKQQWERHFDDRLGLGNEESYRYDNEEKRDLPATEDLLNDKIAHIVPREDFDYAAYEKEGFKLEVPESLYNYGEIYNLCIEKGTLTEEERYKIKEHVIVSIKMLEKIPLPNAMSNIVEYAGTHHETLVGTGYPRKLNKADLSIPARIMAIADIFEALTASDRPYKKAKKLSEAIRIMASMSKDQHIDKDLFALFLRSGVYLNYAQQHLKAEQIDEVDIASCLAECRS